ncbi:hypothetical protein U9M48_005070 [Paspalum notatum var. saurae]|uniref:SWIM-type domain-containing protein n=1 Tax=Paspalum notatum var. saurae TaxID=547442 RepID=A0AAQ3PPB9_PASNO
MCESFNNWIVDIRAHPIISMLEGIRTKVYVRIQQNRTKSNTWGTRICPNILKKMNKCSAIWNGKDCFEVKEFDKRYKVDIGKRTCSCRYWQLAGIPCAHAITSLFLSSKAPEDYIADCYSVDHYNSIYDHCMLPMEGIHQWPLDQRKPKPPAYVKMPGRPKKERRREVGELKKAKKLSKVGMKVTCSKCHKTGHNSRTCNKYWRELCHIRSQGPEGLKVVVKEVQVIYLPRET